jgi:hypothetical protein
MSMPTISPTLLPILMLLDDMKTDKGAIWDAGSVWEITLSNWAPTPKKFVIHLDDIRFE